MSEGWIRFLIWLGASAIWFFVLNVATKWPTAGVVLAAMVLGLICSFLDAIIAAIFAGADPW